MNISNICVFGTDNRMDYVAQTFYDFGYDVYRDITCVHDHAAVILPPPVGDNVMSQVLPYLRPGYFVYGGMISNRFMHECNLISVSAFDYLTWDHVTEKNAILTGKGIIKEAVSYGAVLEESNCLVTGYGFCGKALAKLLSKSGAHVDVMVRKRSLATELCEGGYGYVDMQASDHNKMDKYSYVFNTVPALVLDSDVLKCLSSNVMIFDIASIPGGTDFDFCKEHDIFAVNSLGIPGKEFPKEAGEIIAHAVIADISRR